MEVEVVENIVAVVLERKDLMEVLEQRLRSRATDKEEAILKRLKQAKNEMEFAKSAEAPHDKIVVNDDLDKAYKEAKEFIIGS